MNDVRPDTDFHDVIARLIAISEVTHYEKDKAIVRPGDPGDTLCYVINGSLSVAMVGADQRPYEIAYLHEGDFIGELGLFVGASSRQVLIQSRTYCTLATISHRRLWEALERELKDCAVTFLKLVGARLSHRLMKNDRKLVSLKSEDIRGRIWRVLQELSNDPLAGPHPRGKIFTIPREELSRLVGCSRERASKTLTQLKAEGLIDTEGRAIIVLDAPQGKFSE